MKKTAIILMLALALSILIPSGAMAEDSGAYIVKLKEQTGDTVSLMALSNVEEISETGRLYRAASLRDVQRLGDAVEYYEPDCEARLFAVTNDRLSNRQWWLEFLSVDRAWNRGYDGRGVKVAVIDSGVNSMHEDFEDTLFGRGTNMINGSHDVTDNLGHGTMVCGILAATANNFIGIAGLCDRITVVPLKCFDYGDRADASYIISAIYEAVDIYDCDVINMSLGMESDLRSLRQAVNYASGKGAIIVSAVGNDGNSVLNYPAAYDNVIGVGSVDEAGVVSSFSHRNSSVFVTAPGEELVSLGIEGSNSYSISSGTSDAAPMVTAAAAMLKQVCPNADVNDLMNLLKASVRDAGVRGYDVNYGYGILDMDAFTRQLTGYVFPDVNGHWAEDSVGLCLGRGYFRGVSERSFAPDSWMTRGMFVTLVSRLSGEDISGYENTFTDVPAGSYYAQACAWGAENGIVMGDGSGVFMPEGNVTREQMATFLYRFAQLYGLTKGSPDLNTLSGYTDSASIDGYAREAMAWAVGEGLITGRGGGQLAPRDNARRSEVAALIDRFVSGFNI